MKKLNIENPVETAVNQFITVPLDDIVKEKPDLSHNSGVKKPVPIQNRPKTDKNGRELKRKRYNLLLLPSLYDDIRKIAHVEEIATNEAINRALALYRDEKKSTLAKYDEIKKLKASDEIRK